MQFKVNSTGVMLQIRPAFIPEVLILIFQEGSVRAMCWCWCCSQFPLTFYSLKAALKQLQSDKLFRSFSIKFSVTLDMNLLNLLAFVSPDHLNRRNCDNRD